MSERKRSRSTPRVHALDGVRGASGVVASRGVGALLLLLASVCSALAGAWALAFGLTTGGLLVLGVLGHEVQKLMEDRHFVARAFEHTSVPIWVFALVSVVPTTVTGLVICLTNAHQRFLMFVAGNSFAFAISILLLLLAVAASRNLPIRQ